MSQVTKRDEIRNDEHPANIEYRINRRPKACLMYRITPLIGKDT